MRHDLMGDIHRYIGFLEKCGYAISFSCISNSFSPFVHDIMQYDFHPHAVCNYLKQHPATAGKCVRNKRRLAAKGVESIYYGCCYAGVEEYLIPLLQEDALLLCIHVSGYRGKLSQSLLRMEKTAALCGTAFREAYRALSPQPPDLEQVLSFVQPLGYMLLRLHEACCLENPDEGQISPSGQLYIRAIRWIHEHYEQPLSCDIMAEELKYSASYLRYVFRREGQTTVQKKINEIRLNYAKRLLRGTAMSITEISYAVGIADSNYFSSMFRKAESVSPRAYRRQMMEDRQ